MKSVSFFLSFFATINFRASLMASESEPNQVSSLLERFVRQRDVSLVLPFIVGVTRNIPARQNPEEESAHAETNSNSNERVILINPFTQSMVIIEGASSFDSLIRNLGGNKSGQPPASKASVAAMPSFKVEQGSELGECAVCLEEYEAGDVAREMPCKHRFHGECIQKWLEIHGSCPVCRYEMPVDEESEKKIDEPGRELFVSFSFGNGGTNSDRSETAAPATPPPSNGSDNDSSSLATNPGSGDEEPED